MNLIDSLIDKVVGGTNPSNALEMVEDAIKYKYNVTDKVFVPRHNKNAWIVRREKLGDILNNKQEPAYFVKYIPSGNTETLPEREIEPIKA